MKKFRYGFLIGSFLAMILASSLVFSAQALSAESSDSAKNYPGEVLYKGTPLYQFFLGSPENVIKFWGTPSDKNEYGFSYDDGNGYLSFGTSATFSPSGATESITSITSDKLSLFEVDGITLKNSRKDLIGVFGVPSNENWDRDELWITFERATYSLTVIFIGDVDVGISDEDMPYRIVMTVNSRGYVEAAIKDGADVNARNKYGVTALMFLASHSDPEEISLLLQNGADVNAEADDGQTALMSAASNNPNPEVISLLLKNGADVNARGGGYTALMYAASSNPNSEVISVLLQNGADINVDDFDGNTALDLAADNPNPEIAAILAQAAPLRTDVDTLMNALNTNAFNANNTYNGKYLELAGKLAAIDSSGRYFSLHPFNDKYAIVGVRCDITKEQQYDLARLQTGQGVIVIGRITDVGEVLGYTLSVESIR